MSLHISASYFYLGEAAAPQPLLAIGVAQEGVFVKRLDVPKVSVVLSILECV